MLLRPATDSDRHAIRDLHRAAIQNAPSSLYSPEQIEAWAASCTPERYRIGLTECHVAGAGSPPLGFAELSIHASEIAALVVVADVLGRYLLDYLEFLARERGLPLLTATAALHGADLYEAHGYRITQRHATVERQGVSIPCVRLSKSLAGPGLKPAWLIRPARPEDCAGICEAHIASINALCAPHYSPDQVAAWLDGKTPALYAPLLEQFLWFVAEEAGSILGFGALEPNRAPGGAGEINGLYLSPAGAGRGIGRALMRRMESVARELGAGTLIVKATTNAAPFYAHCGFLETARTTHRTRSGVELPSVAMEKRIASS